MADRPGETLEAGAAGTRPRPLADLAGASGSGSGRRHHPRHPRPGARRPRHRERRRAAARELFQPLRHRARRHRYRKSRPRHEPHGAADRGAAHHRQDQAAWPGRGARRRAPARQHRPQGQGDGAGAVHHEPPMPGRSLWRRGRPRHGLCRRGQCRDQGPVRGGRRRCPGRRALDAAIPRQGPRLWARCTQPGAGRRWRNRRGASVLRLCRRRAR